MVAKRAVSLEEPLLGPAGVPLWPEEVGAHVVVHAVHVVPVLGEVGDDFAADETAGSGDEQPGHSYPVPELTAAPALAGHAIAPRARARVQLNDVPAGIGVS